MSSAPLPLEEDTRDASEDRAYGDLLDRLNRISLTKNYQPLVDIPWDDPEYAIDPEDPRWDIPFANTLLEGPWVRSRPPEVRSRLGLHMIASFMKIGLQFENGLTRGLLEFALQLPDRSREFRYAYHEVIEESHHTLMFQEFVNRSGLRVRGLPRPALWASHRIARLGRRFPELFFFFVLGGEDPIDYVQRELLLGSGHELHPLLRRVSQIHVTEEARHISFARAYLRRNVPRLSPLRRHLLRARVPLLLGGMSRFMMEPSSRTIRSFGIPPSALSEAYRENPKHGARVQTALGKVTQLSRELGLLRPPYDRLWRKTGITSARS